jgi:phenylacetate-coenzyme A ligase PaaK-like adenylate-forming protein
MRAMSEANVPLTDYETTRQQHIAQFVPALGRHAQRIGWPRDQILAEQQAALRRLLRVAKEGSPWHRARLAGINPDDADASTLSVLPVMTKDDLMAHWDDIVTDRGVTLAAAEEHLERLTTDAYFMDRYHVVASSGSSGRRGVFAWDWDGWLDANGGVLRWLIWRGMTDPVLRGLQPIIATVAAEAPSHMSSAAPQTFASPALRASRFAVTMPIAQVVAGLNEVQPTVVIGYPSMLAELAHQARSGALHIAPKQIVGTSEPLLPEIRALLGQTWDAPVGNWWGTSEAGPTGISCHFGAGMHLSEDMMIIEPVDEYGAPVPPGTRAHKVLLTNLINPLLPLIRYEVTDEVTVLDEPCPCGSAFRRVDDIQGRVDDCFSYAGGVTVHPHVFRSPLSRAPEIIEYQVRQTADGAHVQVRCAGATDTAKLGAEIEEHLRRVGLADPRVAVEQVDAIPRAGSGKLKRFLPL